MRRIAIVVGVIVALCVVGLVAARSSRGIAPAQQLEIAAPPEPQSSDAGLDVAVAVAEPTGPKVCVRARSKPVAAAEVAYADQSVRTGDDGCVELPAPRGRELDVCARSGAGAACTHAVAVADGAWLPLTLELSSSGKLRVEVVDLRGRPVADADVTVRTFGVDWHARTSAGGVVIVEHLPVGHAGASAAARGYTGNEYAHAEIPASDMARVRISLDRAAAIAGVVLEPSGQRAGALEIDALAGTSNRLFKPLENDDGGFRFDVDSPGPYDVRVHVPGFARAIMEVTAPDERVAIKLEPGFPLDVSVTGSKGKPVPANLVIDAEGQTAFQRIKATTDEHGLAHFDDLPASDISVLFTAADDAEEPCRVASRAHFHVDAEHGSLALRITAGLEISGKLVDVHGKPVMGQVLVTRTDAPFFDASRRFDGASQVNVARDGRFALTCLQPGNYRLEAHAEPSAGADTIVPSVAAGTQGVTLTCHTPALVTGTVLCPDRKPCARFKVSPGTARALGRFEDEVSDIRPLDYRFAAAGAATKSVHVEPREGEHVDLGSITLERARPMRGRVIDSANRVGVAGASISPVADGGVEFEPVTSGPLGDFALDAPGPGALLVRVASRDYQPQTFTFTDGDELALSAGVAVRGRVLDRRGDPMSGVVVFAKLEREGRSVITEPDGAFELKGLHEGTWELHVSRWRSRELGDLDVPRQTLEVPSTGLTDVVLRQRSGGADVLVDVGFTPDDSAEAALVPGDNPAPASSSQLAELLGRALARGHRVRTAYRFDAIPEGTYTFVLARYGADNSTPIAFAHTERLAVSGNGLMRWSAHVQGAYLPIDGELDSLK